MSERLEKHPDCAEGSSASARGLMDGSWGLTMPCCISMGLRWDVNVLGQG